MIDSNTFTLWHFASSLLTDFDEGLWNATVESVTVRADGGMRFRLRDGTEALA